MGKLAQVGHLLDTRAPRAGELSEPARANGQGVVCIVNFKGKS